MVTAHAATRAENIARVAGPLHPRLEEMAQASPALRPLLQRLPRMAECAATVLICGETGTGKELFARAMHYLSPRSHRAWVAVNCAALPTDLVDSELFGHVRGAFTGAHQSRQGMIAEADKGTLFLDEINSLPLASQGRLLRFLQDHEYRPVGADKALRSDVRIVAASNVDLLQLVESGRLRSDLYYRLNVLSLRLPALRERPGDVLTLSQHFLRQHALTYTTPVPRLSAAAVAALTVHDWPGNVRELEHALERAVLGCQNSLIEPFDLDLPCAASAAAIGAGPQATPLQPASFKQAKQQLIEAFERRYLEQLLQQHGGNVSQAACAARKNRRALFELLRKHGIDPARFRVAALDPQPHPGHASGSLATAA